MVNYIIMLMDRIEVSVGMIKYPQVKHCSVLLMFTVQRKQQRLKILSTKNHHLCTSNDFYGPSV